LISCESWDSFSPLSPRVQEDDWYRYLFGKVLDGVEVGALKTIADRLAFVTFNYDRSLEFYLYRCLQSLYDISDSGMQGIFPQFKIIHMYGDLGPIWFERDGVLPRPYGPKLTPEIVEQAADQIVVMHKGAAKGETEAQRQAIALIQAADHI